MLTKCKLVFLLGLICFSAIFADEDTEIKFKKANVFYEFGNIVNAVELDLDTMENQWTQRFGGKFDLEAHRGDNLSLYFGAGTIFWHAIPEIATQTNTQVFYGDGLLTKAYAHYKFGDPDEPVVDLKLGAIPVRYSMSRNLGEYMFRTGTYPCYIITGNPFTTVNVAGAMVLGTQLNHNISEMFSHSLFFTSERSSFPLHDFSLTYMANLNTPIIKAGFGLQLNRLIPVKPSKTTPTLEKNKYFKYEGEWYTSNLEYYRFNSMGSKTAGDTATSLMWDSTRAFVDSLLDLWDTNTVTKPTMEKFTFQGIKPVLTASIDFGAIIGSDIIRKDEFVLYTEGVLMGIKDYPIFYEKASERIAWMAGINIPTFGLLTTLNAEVEYYPSPYVNGYRTAREGKRPHPDFDYKKIDGYNPDDWTSDDLKWSIFLDREITKGVAFQAQIASDHLRGRRGSRVVSENSILVDESHWYYMAKIDISL
ncbi:MAG: hypothetical protein HQK83_18550 [Fibrobacteria bacterium]|nr:hypothetical protein [Fibrobacteria bacterium]